MSEWRECKIKDIALNMADAPFGSNLKTEDYTENGAIVLQGKNIQGRKCVWNDARFVSQEKYYSLSRHHAKLGCLVFPKVGTIGKVGILTRCGEITEYLLSTNSMMLEPNQKIAHQDFIYYFFSSAEVSNHIKSISSNSVQPVFNFTSLKNYTVNLPPLQEQKAIAAVLSSLDNKIDLLHRQNKTLEAMAETLFKQWFVVEAREDWEEGNIYKLIDVIYGYPFKSKIFNEEKIGLPLIRIRDLSKGFSNIYTDEQCDDKFVLNNGDLVAGMDGEFKLYIWSGNKSVLNQRCCKFVTKYDFVPYFFVFNLIKPHLYYYENVKVGTTVIHLGKSDMDDIRISIPPKDLLISYGEIVNPMYEKLNKNSKQIKTLETLRDTLLPKLMSGEVRVKLA